MEFFRFMFFIEKMEKRQKDEMDSKIANMKFLVMAIHTDNPNLIIENLTNLSNGEDSVMDEEILDLNKFDQFKNRVESYKQSGVV